MNKNIKKVILSIFIIFVIGLVFYKNEQFQHKSKLPSEAQSLMKSGIANLKKNSVKNAIDDFSALTKLYPNLAIGHYNLGLAYAQSNLLNKSIEEWQKTAEIDKDFAGAYFNLAQAYKLTNNNEKAAFYLNKYLFLKPKDKNAQKIKEEIRSLQTPSMGQGVIGKIYLSDSANTKNIKSIFSPKTSVITAFIEVNKTPLNTKLETKWGYIALDNSIIPVNSTKTTVKGTKKVITSIKKPVKDWPQGQYELKILVDGKENAIKPFFVQE